MVNDDNFIAKKFAAVACAPREDLCAFDANWTCRFCHLICLQTHDCNNGGDRGEGVGEDGKGRKEGRKKVRKVSTRFFLELLSALMKSVGSQTTCFANFSTATIFISSFFYAAYWKCNFPITPHVRLSVG